MTISSIVALIWLGTIAFTLLALGQKQQGYKVLRPGQTSGEGDLPRVAVIVPARNEAQTIARCLSGLLAQDYPRARLGIYVVDDDSTDETASVVRHIASSNTAVRLIEIKHLPEDWIGKAHACWRGAEASDSEWLCFVDADTFALTPLLKTAVLFSEANKVDMLSLHPFQELGTFWEKLVIPEGFFLLGLTMDIQHINDPARPDAAANGQFILIRRSVYEAVRGHAAVRRELVEDVALARLVKRAGYRVCLMGGNELIRTRMYSSLTTLWEGLSKNAAELMARRHPWRAVLTALWMLWIGWGAVLFPVTALTDFLAKPSLLGGVFLGAITIGAVAMFAAHIAAMTTFFRTSWFYGLLFPFGFTMSAAITLNSLWRHLRGRNTWKGRILPS